MNEYMKPDYEVMVFEANEYVSACPWQVGNDLSASCGGTNITIELVKNQGGDVWTAAPANSDGEIDSNVGGQGMLYPIFKKEQVNETTWKDVATGEYGFGGSIYQGHTGSYVSGEYYAASQIAGGKVGDSYGHGLLCGCYLLDQSGSANVGMWHHHLTNVRSKNFS